jgi:broad specificity phosphatase PhoE
MRTYMIRHGKPAATWGDSNDDGDPGLDDVGRAQAQAAAEALLALPEPERPTRVVSSPLRRCRETAAPFAAALGVELIIDPMVGEIPTPSTISHDDRGAWLRNAFAGRWGEIVGDLDYDAWRRGVAAAVAGYPATAVFSHSPSTPPSRRPRGMTWSWASVRTTARSRPSGSMTMAP